MKFRIQTRFHEFWQRLLSAEYLSPLFYLHLGGWLFLFFAVEMSLPHSIVRLFPLFLIWGYFWFKLVDDVYQKIRPPSEILIVVFLLFFVFERLWLTIPGPQSSPGDSIGNAGIFLSAIQFFWLAILILLFSFILIQNSRGKKGSLVSYAVLGYVGIQILNGNTVYLWYLFLFFMVLLLYRKTIWAEELSRIECWVYIWIFLILFLNFPSSVPLARPSELTAQTYLWYFMPAMLFIFFKLYLLAVLIKIPFVIVYHHASLSRKLRIAGWLQSSIPQLIQLLLLLVVFYFFIAGWQAGNVRDVLQDKIHEIAGNHNTTSTLYSFPYDSTFQQVQIPGYNPLQLSAQTPNEGVIALPGLHASSTGNSSLSYFIYTRLSEDGQNFWNFVKVDSTFLSGIAENLHVLAGSRLAGYPFKLSKWDSLFSKIRGWQGNTDGAFQVYPFGIIPQKSPQILSAPFPGQIDASDSARSRIRIKIINQDAFTIGKVMAPLYNSKFVPQGYWAFDVVLTLTPSFMVSPLMRQFYFWFVIYLLLNLLVIRRVVKFGNQINQMIVQKFNQLKTGIRHIAAGNLDFKISLEGEDEFVELAGHFNQMGEKLEQNISELREKDRLEYELSIARDVQLSLLPRALPQAPGFHIAATVKTANEVGGDFYDVLPLDEGRYLFVIGDVSGKSTSAAFYMAQCISLFRFSRQFSSDPREILLRLNRYFSEPMVDRQIFVTAIAGILDTHTHQIKMFRAGHNQPVFVPAGQTEEVSEVASSGLGIGLERSGEIFESLLEGKTIELKPGDALVFYTDGLVEAAFTSANAPNGRERREFFGEDKLRGLLTELRGRSAQQMLNRVVEDLDKFYGNNPLVDDYTILAIQREKDPEDKNSI